MKLKLLKLARFLRLISKRKYNEKRQIEIIRHSSLFDEKWYLTQNPDVAAQKKEMSAAEHYFKYGWKEGRNPSKDFDGNAYLFNNNDVYQSAINPLIHYETCGFKERRKVIASINTTSSTTDIDYLRHRMDVLNSGLWDENYFLSKYYDDYKTLLYSKSRNNIYSPLDYYLQDGWKKKQWPSNKFVYYHPTYHNMNPLLYFLNFARFDGYQFEYNVWHLPQSKIDNYWKNSSKHKNKKVIYTCILNNYDNLINHYFISNDWDYICFTDDDKLIQKKKYGIWQIKPLQFNQLDATRNNRWHKMHPHILFPEYEESIYIDANINVITSYLFDIIEERKEDLLFPMHYKRNCIYQEINSLINSSRYSADDKKVFLEQKRFLEENGFPYKYGLGENNVIYRKHHSQEIIDIMNDWWEMMSNFSKRDQTSLAFVMWRHNRKMCNHMFTNIRINYKNFWIVKHLSEQKDWNIK